MIKFMTCKTYIYTLSNHNGEVRYVGKSNNPIERNISHISESKRKVNTYKNNWINNLLKNGQYPIMEIIDEVDISEWQFWEKYWISQFKAWGFKLTNGTDGGDGGNTFKTLPTFKKLKTKEKLSKSRNFFYKTHENANKGKKLSEEVKNKISKNNSKYWLGKTHSNETKDKISFSLIGKKLSEITKLKIGKKSKNRLHSEESKEKIRIANIGKKLSEQTKNKFRKPIIQFDLDNNLIKEWPSIKDAQDKLSIKNISNVCCEKRKSCGGFIWKFKDKLYELD